MVYLRNDESDYRLIAHHTMGANRISILKYPIIAFKQYDIHLGLLSSLTEMCQLTEHNGYVEHDENSTL